MHRAKYMPGIQRVACSPTSLKPHSPPPGGAAIDTFVWSYRTSLGVVRASLSAVTPSRY
ncbi:hypothetical protein BDP27DRAFT_1318629 [Rhodocollybia butyracea]|uniref:Uncharacterized protein n=1 Tax=Rhodocollybia butyracea TaxID=206335 RepID=A0A9P5UC08_9AGAR|nr:hypothetical protein BDP27DRAFT_1318629 [Rhodocollybia butyracea]